MASPITPKVPTSGVGMAQAAGITKRQVADASKGLLRRAWSTQIAYESVQYDPIMNIPSLTGQIKTSQGKNGTVFTAESGKVIQDATPKGDDKYARSITIQFTKSLEGSGHFGDSVDDVMGDEEDVRLKYFNVYSADYGHAVTGQSYGVDYRELKPTAVYEETKPLLAQWYGELTGYWCRRAICQSVSPNLLESADLVSAGVAESLNANTYIPNVGLFREISYATLADYENAVADALNAVPGDSSTDDYRLSVRDALEIVDAATDSYIKPVSWQGYELYILWVGKSEFTNMLDPQRDGSFNKYWVEAAALGDGSLHKVIPGAEMVIGNSIVIARDPRTAFAKATEATGAADTIAFSYLLPGRNDQRVSAVAGAPTGKFFNSNLLVGENALVKFYPEPGHYKVQLDNYKKYENSGYFGAAGYMSPKFNDDAADIAAGQQESSMVVFTPSKKGLFKDF